MIYSVINAEPNLKREETEFAFSLKFVEKSTAERATAKYYEQRPIAGPIH